MDSYCFEVVEVIWVLFLVFKGLYKILKVYGFEEIYVIFFQIDLLKLLVKKCSKGIGFSKMWFFWDLEILFIMLYFLKKEMNVLVEYGDLELDE